MMMKDRQCDLTFENKNEVAINDLYMKQTKQESKKL